MAAFDFQTFPASSLLLSSALKFLLLPSGMDVHLPAGSRHESTASQNPLFHLPHEQSGFRSETLSGRPSAAASTSSFASSLAGPSSTVSPSPATPWLV
ncbi:UNVERIFIED_CONTAM: hypothetical protein Sindi_3023400, partial [Sesamum indicum]